MGILNSLINAGSQQMTNDWNYRMNESTNDMNKAIADSTNRWNFALAERQNDLNRQLNKENIAFQRETNDLNYQRQKAENDLTRVREDTAYSRAAKDMEAAGLSKTLAAGSPASSASMTASQAQAPQNKFGYERATMQRYERKAFKAEALKVDADILSSLQKIKSIEQSGAQLDYQNWLNDFVGTYNMLPGNNGMVQGVLALGSLVEQAMSSVRNALQGTVDPSFTFGFKPQGQTANSTPMTVSDIANAVNSSVEPSKTSATRFFDAKQVAHMPLESETKNAISRSSGEILIPYATKGTAPSVSKKEVTVQEGKTNMRKLPATVSDQADGTAQHKKMSYEDLYLPPVYNTKAKKWALAGLAGALMSGPGSKVRYKMKDIDNWWK